MKTQTLVECPKNCRRHLHSSGVLNDLCSICSCRAFPAGTFNVHVNLSAVVVLKGDEVIP